ncbi:MAG TPA: condensation domain-containing protein, partial [Longimicrobiaceae bacterium]|nr:condensation domain-containing protein [Longimicrobiaceae bacterium]
MSRHDVEAIYPLSPLQEGMLFHAAYGDGAAPYVVQIRHLFHGALDVEALRRAWGRVMDRHPALRTSFVWKRRDQPLQVVRRGVEAAWTVEDWRGVPPAEREERLRRYLEADRARGFELESVPLMR